MFLAPEMFEKLKTWWSHERRFSDLRFLPSF